MRANAKVCLLYCVTRQVASTYGRSMTNGANYTKGKLHHSPWHSDIRTSNQLNTPPGRLSRPFQTKNSKHRGRGANQTLWISSKQTCPINKFAFRRHSRCHFLVQFRYHCRDHFRSYRGHFRGHSSFQSRDHFRDHSRVQFRSFPSQHTAS